eukprot:g41093.t1
MVEFGSKIGSKSGKAVSHCQGVNGGVTPRKEIYCSYPVWPTCNSWQTAMLLIPNYCRVTWDFRACQVLLENRDNQVCQGGEEHQGYQVPKGEEDQEALKVPQENKGPK